jgi:hypothetical protein
VEAIEESLAYTRALLERLRGGTPADSNGG